MNHEKTEELLSRGLDGELTLRERAELDRLLTADPELRKMEAEWLSYARALKAQPVPLPPTPEVAWADVQRAIRLDAARRDEVSASVFGWRMGWAGAMIAIVLLGFSTIALRQAMAPRQVQETASTAKDVEVEFVESDLPGASPMVYEDAETGWTVIWVAGLENGPDASNGT